MYFSRFSMRETFILNVVPRADEGKGASRRLRHTGEVPAVIYGGNSAPQSLSTNHNELLQHLGHEAFYSHILTVQFADHSEQAVLKAVQRHPAKPRILHLDLQRVVADRPLRMKVPLHFVGQDVAPGVKTGGGNIEHHVNEVLVECLPANLPEYIAVDCSGLNIADTVHLSNLTLPEGVVLVALKHKDDASVLVVHAPKVVEVAPVEVAPAKGKAKKK
jgi:large subunit ribosomal protein L25